MQNRMSHWLTNGKYQADLEAAGFARSRCSRHYALDGVSLAFDDGWLVLRTAAGDGPEDLLTGHQGQPGLWKWVEEGEEACKLFEIPPAVFSYPDPVEGTVESRSPFRQTIDWAMATREGGLPQNWSEPPEEEVASCIPPEGLTLQAGSYTCQGWLEQEPGRLALRIPIVTDIPKDLPCERTSWLRHVLLTAQNKCRLVRMGISECHSGLTVSVEVDLSGVARPMLEPMVEIALPALRYAARWVVSSTVFLTMSRNGCRAMEAGAVKPGEKPLSVERR